MLIQIECTSDLPTLDLARATHDYDLTALLLPTWFFTYSQPLSPFRTFDRHADRPDRKDPIKKFFLHLKTPF